MTAFNLKSKSKLLSVSMEREQVYHSTLVRLKDQKSESTCKHLWL